MSKSTSYMHYLRSDFKKFRSGPNPLWSVLVNSPKIWELEKHHSQFIWDTFKVLNDDSDGCWLVVEDFKTSKNFYYMAQLFPLHKHLESIPSNLICK
jgi:hypothetical protein